MQGYDEQYTTKKEDATPGELIRELEDLRQQREKLKEAFSSVEAKIINAETAIQKTIEFLHSGLKAPQMVAEESL